MLIPFQSPSLFSSSSHQSCARPSALLLPNNHSNNPSPSPAAAASSSSSSNSSIGSTSSSHLGVEGPAFIPVSGFGYVQKGSHGARCLSSGGGGLNEAPTYSSSCSYAYPVCSATILRFNVANQKHKFARLAACREVLRKRKVQLPGEVARNPFEMSTIITINAQGVQQRPHMENAATSESPQSTIMSPYSRSLSAQSQPSSLLLSPSAASAAAAASSSPNKPQQPAPWPPASYFTRLHQAFLAENNNNNAQSPSSGSSASPPDSASSPTMPPMLLKTQSAPGAMETEQVTVSISPMIGSSSLELDSADLMQCLSSSGLLSPSSESLPSSIPVLKQSNSEAPLLRLPSKLHRHKSAKSNDSDATGSAARTAASSQQLIAKIRARKRLLEIRSSSSGSVKEMTLLKRKNNSLNMTSSEWQQSQTESGGRTSLLRRSHQSHFSRSHSLPLTMTPSSSSLASASSSSRASHSSPSLRASKKMMMEATTSPLHQALTSVAAQVAASPHGLESLYEDVLEGNKSHNNSMDADALNISTSSVDVGGATAISSAASADGFQKARSPSKLLEALQKMNNNGASIASPDKPLQQPTETEVDTSMKEDVNTSSDLSAANDDDVLLSFVALAGGLRDSPIAPQQQKSSNDETPAAQTDAEPEPVLVKIEVSCDERIDSDEPQASSEGDVSTLNATSSSSSSSSSSSPSIPLLTEHLVVQTTSPSLGSQASDAAGATHVSHDSSQMLSDEDGEEVEYMALGGEMSIELLTDCSTHGTTSPTISPPINATKPQNEQAKQLFSLLIQS